MLTSKTETIDCELPPSPRILIVAPQPFGVDQTRSTPHIDALEETLSLHDPLLSRQRNLRVVHTWEDFRQQLTDFAPQIVYYYGHGQGDEHTADLIFATGPNLAVKEVPVADFALALRNMETPPLLAYVNCCQGDAAGYLGVGKQLEDFIPAVITNRTKAQIDAAQAQAMALWESILLRGIPPHRSVADLYSRLGDLGLSLADLRWMTPVLHGHYGTWRANPPRPPGRLVHDPYWHLKIDRVTQFGTVATQSRQMLRERKPRSHVFVWYGRQGEGLEIFHHRLHIELREDLSNGHIYEVRPEWPMEFSNPGRSFHDMLVEAFGVRGLDDIPARIRSQTSGATGVQTLVYVRHLPVTSPKIMNPGLLKTYIEWWDSNFIPLLERNQYALLGVSFQVNNPPRFRKIVQEEDRLDELDLHDTVFRLLTEMENVARSDLLNFLRTHNIRLPLERRDQVLDQILEKTGGAYEQTVEELRNVVDMAWRIPEEETETPDPSEEIEYDY